MFVSMKKGEGGGLKVIWYCSFCGRYHTGLTKAYDFSGWIRKGKDKSKDNLCGKGLLFISLLKDTVVRRQKCRS